MVHWHVSAFLATATSCGACSDPKLSYLFTHDSARSAGRRHQGLVPLAMNPEFTAQLTSHQSDLRNAVGWNEFCLPFGDPW
ncbi:hypothetical protein EDB89DRAFT_2009086 [Lactarius sanguifluus]|nr:hypothetical protein EDB89DRAFT_2009086 [Lactarius sanguifluus]